LASQNFFIVAMISSAVGAAGFFVFFLVAGICPPFIAQPGYNFCNTLANFLIPAPFKKWFPVSW
jgi:hypothetical protein